MAPHVSENLSRLKVSTSELNKLADEATAQIKALSTFLDDLNPGIAVRDKWAFHTGREDNTSGHTVPAHYRLAYGRDDASGKFGLVVEAEAITTDAAGKRMTTDDDEWEHEDVWVRRLDQCPRPMRVAAVVRLPEFIAVLAEAIDKAVAEVKQNVEMVREASTELQAALGAHRQPEVSARDIVLTQEDIDSVSKGTRRRAR